MIRQRDALSKLPNYRQGASPETDDVVKLSSNEVPFEPLAAVKQAIAAEIDTANIYPDMMATALRERLAQKHDIDPMQIAVGAGSVEVASQLIAATCDEGDEVLFAWRSFEAYPVMALTHGAEPVMVPLTEDERHDFDAMAAAITDKTRLIIICNPNNPTGATCSHAGVEAFMQKVPKDVLVVIDEAYEHFNRDPETALGLDFFKRYDNVAVLHTFSKAYGLAGLRVGYAIAPIEVCDNLRKVCVPFAVTALAQRAACASLDAEDELSERIEQLVSERERVIEQVRETGWNVVDSHGNFFWLRLNEDTERVLGVLFEYGVLSRPFHGEGLRITIGDPAANDRVVHALRAARELISA